MVVKDAEGNCKPPVSEEERVNLKLLMYRYWNHSFSKEGHYKNG
jgi:hypothetical protein